MPTMKEIYDFHSIEYDELVTKEDYQNNLKNYLLNNFDFKNKSIIELGAGTGRLTKIYAKDSKNISIYDRSSHMMDKAKLNLKEFSESIKFGICDNLNINEIKEKADIILEGWSFGHTAIDKFETITDTIKELIDNCKSMLNSGGTIIIIETLGTNYNKPTETSPALSKLFSILENSYNFKRYVLRTDYKFDSEEDAKRVTSYFFGEKFAKNLKNAKNGIVKEYTGVWSFSTNHDQ